MDAVMAVDVLASPAVQVLCELERDGFSVTVTVDGTLRISPRSKLTADRMHVIEGCRDALRLLVRACDPEVQARRTVFARQLDTPPLGVLVPRLLFRSGIPYAEGSCFSCGDALPRHVFGRCWRCALAWRLAARVALTQDLLDAHAHAKVAG